MCVCAKSDQHFTVCLIVPNEKQLRMLLSKEDKRGDELGLDFRSLCTNKVAVDAVTKSIIAHAQKCKFFFLFCFFFCMYQIILLELK